MTVNAMADGGIHNVDAVSDDFRHSHMDKIGFAGTVIAGATDEDQVPCLHTIRGLRHGLRRQILATEKS